MTSQKTPELVLTPGEQRVLDYYRALPPGAAQPSNDAIGRQLGLAPGTVKFYRAQLANQGLIVRQRSPAYRVIAVARQCDDTRFKPADRFCFCLGPLCMGRKRFHSRHAGERFCDNCRDAVTRRW